MKTLPFIVLLSLIAQPLLAHPGTPAMHEHLGEAEHMGLTVLCIAIAVGFVALAIWFVRRRA